MFILLKSADIFGNYIVFINTQAEVFIKNFIYKNKRRTG